MPVILITMPTELFRTRLSSVLRVAIYGPGNVTLYVQNGPQHLGELLLDLAQDMAEGYSFPIPNWIIPRRISCHMGRTSWQMTLWY